MRMKKIIAFVGMPGSGKGTCTDYLAETHHYPVVHFGNMLYEEVQRRGLNNNEDENFVRTDMREKEGPAVFAKHAARKADEYFADGAKVVVFDGLYSWGEYKFLSEQYGDDLVTVAIAAPKALRRQRVLDRKDSHRKYTLEQLIAREIAELETIDKGAPIAYADYTIVNNQDKQHLLDELEAILKNALK